MFALDEAKAILMRREKKHGLGEHGLTFLKTGILF